jgi:hypothetical protein
MFISILLYLVLTGTSASEGASFKFALLKYHGGGDWYANPTSLTNLSNFCNSELQMDLNPDYATVEVGSADLFNYPFVHMTGHGNVVFSVAEAENLRTYLIAGGFLYIDDNFGMDPYIRIAMKKVFPETDFIEIPWEHPIYHQRFNFDKGLPKIHQHEGKAPQGFGILWQGRIVCFYTYECDLGDGWEDPDVHKDPPAVRRQALEMGANIVSYAFSGVEKF